MLRTFVALILLSAPALAAPPPVKEAWDRNAPTAGHAWVRLNAVPGRPAAGYLTITGGGQPDRLVAVTAPGVRVEMHSMTMAGGVMSMQKLDGLAVPAGAIISFAPGGNHLMLFGLGQVPASLPLTLKFASGKSLVIPAQIRNAGDDAPPPADHSVH
ncbi:MAG: hypothetical protein RL490_1587 [Pseudomonadota bacterium]